ncbi:MAG: hypothetical protein NC548_28430 [Lachnospiraceae bacterium]|nr:hypothetical protein [Lachnospiraceae bacterium]MCM1232019.1 hypothetical protein [Ruminococcus flavefaciens]
MKTQVKTLKSNKMSLEDDINRVLTGSLAGSKITDIKIIQPRKRLFFEKYFEVVIIYEKDD